MTFVAIINVPGYLPETDPVEFETTSDAWAYLADRRREDEDSMEDPIFGTDEPYSDTVNELDALAALSGVHTGVVVGYTSAEHDLGIAYSVMFKADEDE